jgi:hypothetical protein
MEICVRRLDSTSEVGRFSQAIHALGAKVPHAIAIVDLRTPIVFSDEVASAVADLMTRATTVRKRTAILLSNRHAVLGLQLGRIARQVGDPTRRNFTDPAALLAWLETDLSPHEIARARAFLASKQLRIPA